MKLIEGIRTFFILCSDGETYYFTLNSNGEIYCKDFAKAYEANKKRCMPPAHSIDFCGHNFSLKNESGETIYSIMEHKKGISNNHQLQSPSEEELPLVEMLYIDNDVRMALIALNKLQYDTEASQIPGLLYEPVMQQGHSRKRNMVNN